MSRSWTPQEHYWSYLYLLKQGTNLRAYGGKSPNDDFGFLELGLYNMDGTGTPFYNAEDKKILKQFKELGYYFKGFMQVWNATKEHPRKRRQFFNKLEKDLQTIEKYDISGNLNNLPQDVDSTLLRWYLGNPNDDAQYIFNAHFCDYIYKKVMGKVNTEVDFLKY